MKSFLFLTLFLTAIAFGNGKCPSTIKVPECKCRTLADEEKDEISILKCENLYSEEGLISALAAVKGYQIFELELVNCSLRYLPDDGFVGTTFEVLNLRDSNLHSLSNTDIAFKGLEKSLHMIDVTSCSFINDWDWMQLSDIAYLFEVHVSHSDLVDITKDLSKIQHKNIEAFSFQKNQIEELDEQTFAPFLKLKSLSLDYNHISLLKRNMFPRPAKHLTVIGLSYNDLRDLPEDIFEDMPALDMLLLTGNPLHTIDEAVFRPIWKQLRILTFGATRLSCDCRIKWLAKADKYRKSLYGRCRSPSALKGKEFHTLKEEELFC